MLAVFETGAVGIQAQGHPFVTLWLKATFLDAITRASVYLSFHIFLHSPG